MKSYKEYIVEAKLQHLEHIEDSIFGFGIEGGKSTIVIMKDLIASLQGHSSKPINIQTKVDGAPSVVAGINPENGKFFVGTKSLFNKNPKVNYTAQDVEANHGHAPGLAEKLKVALVEFPKMNIVGILQGDFLFIPSDLKTQTIDGTKYVTFTPNTITYAVPADSELAASIKRAKVGVVWHTTYTGSTIADMSASFSININKLKRTPDVWFTDTNFKDVSGVATFTAKEQEAITKELNAAQAELMKLDKTAAEILFGSGFIAENLKIFINSRVRTGKTFDTKKSIISDFIDFIKEKNVKRVQELKSEKAKDKATQEFAVVVSSLRKSNVLGTLAHALEWHNVIQSIKYKLIKKLEQVQNIPSFIQTADGFRATGAEGYVIIDVLSNTAVKLVDRLEFSRANFTALKSWS